MLALVLLLLLLFVTEGLAEWLASVQTQPTRGYKRWQIQKREE
jgi:hypothetical protein